VVDDAHINALRHQWNRWPLGAVVTAMLADTDAIRTLGAAHSAQAADLSAAAAALSSLPGAETAALFGPVGAGFLAALALAAARDADAVAALADSTAAASMTAVASAAAYVDADRRVGALIAGG
jgi:hypothetical protein